MAIGESGSSPDWLNTERKTKRCKSTALRKSGWFLHLATAASRAHPGYF